MTLFVMGRTWKRHQMLSVNSNTYPVTGCVILMAGKHRQEFHFVVYQQGIHSIRAVERFFCNHSLKIAVRIRYHVVWSKQYSQRRALGPDESAITDDASDFRV